MASGENIRTKKLAVVQTDNTEFWGESKCLTFVLEGEDHTLGNALRYIIMKNPDVEFCGYSIPHPTENRINLRIQTSGTPAAEVLKKGLKELDEVCEHVLSTFQTSVETYKFREDDVGMET